MKFSVTCGRAVSLPQPLHRKTQPTVMRANKGASQARYPAMCRGQSISHRTINFTGAPVASAVTVGREDRAVWRDIAGAAFFFNDTATTEIYTLSLHDALPI